MTEEESIRLENLLRWIEEQQQNKTLAPCSESDIFDLGQQIADDIKNNNLKNGFVIYDNEGKIRIISIFKDKHKIIPISKHLLTELISYLTRLSR